ncbi:hypothetical protein [Rheinheimera sediminis]|nr:hypothetical protein [Rheinheimera sp. YQF-1]
MLTIGIVVAEVVALWYGVLSSKPQSLNAGEHAARQAYPVKNSCHWS